MSFKTPRSSTPVSVGGGTPRPTTPSGSSRPPSRLRTSSFSIATTPSLVRFSELILCEMCREIVNEPRTLPCNHTFCTACLQSLIQANQGRDDFICPVDRYIIKITPNLGIETFSIDHKVKRLTEVYAGMVEEAKANWLSRHLLGATAGVSANPSIMGDMTELPLDQDTKFEDEIMNLDITLQRLNEALKDIKHSSAISMRTVNEYFDGISAKLKREQQRLMDEISLRCRRQSDIIEFEKYRLIETKKSLHDSLIQSASIDIDELSKPFVGEDDTISTMDSISSDGNRKQCNAAILECHVGQQLIDFNPDKDVLVSLENHFSAIGQIVCDFDMTVNLRRDFSLIDDYPYGIAIGSPAKLPSEKKALSGSQLDPNLFSQPKGLCLSKGFQIAVANSKTMEISIVSTTLDVKNIKPDKGVLQSLSDVAMGIKGEVYAVDPEGNQVVLLAPDGSFIRSTAIPGGVSMDLNRPNGIAIDSTNRVIVSNSLSHNIKIFSSDLKRCLSTITNERRHIQQSMYKMSFPSGVAVGEDDSIYVTDGNNKRIIVFTPEGIRLKEIHSKDFIDPRSVAVSADGHVLVTDREAKKSVFL